MFWSVFASDPGGDEKAATGGPNLMADLHEDDPFHV